MAGHSKWANIKHRKAAQDAKRGKIFTKLIRELVVAAKQGGAEPADNPRLRTAVDKALAANMTKDTIDRAIARGAGAGAGEDVEELTYEGYAPGGAAVLVEVMTDNRNRAVAEVRHAFSKYGGNLGTDGSVAYLFERKARFLFPPNVDEERLLDAALEAGAEDIEDIDADSGADAGGKAVIAPWAAFGQVKTALESAQLPPASVEAAMLAATAQPLDAAKAETLLNLIDALEDLEDVQNVYTNADLPDAPDDRPDAAPARA